MSDYQTFHQNLFTALADQILKSGFLSSSDADDCEFIGKLQALKSDIRTTDDTGSLGQWFINRIVSHYPQLMEITPRELLWYFGGDCLHYLGEDEVARFQLAEERYFEQATEQENIQSYEAVLTNT